MALPLIRPPKKAVNAGLNDHIIKLLEDRLLEYETKPGKGTHMVITLKRVCGGSLFIESVD